MKARVVIPAAVFAAALLVPSRVPAGIHIQSEDDHSMFRGDDVSVNFEDDTIVFTDKESSETVEIAEHGRLFVNGRSVRLSHGQRTLVEHYYETFEGIVEEAKSIGLQGAKLGVKGAALGLKAAAGVLLLISPHYDGDDLERDLDDDEAELERASGELERRAERLEKKADKLERLHEDLREDIDELGELDWF